MAWFFAFAVLGAELCGALILFSDLPRAALVVTVLSPFCLAIAAGSGFSVSVPSLRRHLPTVLGMLIFAAIGVYGVILSLLYKCQPYYAGADLYHWYGEGLLVAAVTTAIFHGISPKRLMWQLTVVLLVMGLIGLLAAIAGTLGVGLAGGHIVPGLKIWRLEGGRGFPIVPLIVVSAILFKGRPRGLLFWLVTAAFFVLSIDLLVALKRSQWLTFAVVLIWLMTPWRHRWTWRAVGLAATILIGLLITIIPNSIETVKQAVFEELSYNPNYNTEESLGERAEQVATVWPYVRAQPTGHGFGATTYAYTPRHDDHAETHYIHNTYLYYAFQIGIPATLLCVLLMGSVIVALARRLNRSPDWNWLVHATLGSLVALSTLSFTILSLHTVLFGFTVGLAALAIANVPATQRDLAVAGARPLHGSRCSE